MTVGADDFAFRDLRDDRGPGPSDQLTPNREFFVAQVVEVQDNWICLAAVNARVCREVFDEKPKALGLKLLLLALVT
jgi:hypothetical protein